MVLLLLPDSSSEALPARHIGGKIDPAGTKHAVMSSCWGDGPVPLHGHCQQSTRCSCMHMYGWWYFVSQLPAAPALCASVACMQQQKATIYREASSNALVGLHLLLNRYSLLLMFIRVVPTARGGRCLPNRPACLPSRGVVGPVIMLQLIPCITCTPK